MTNKKSRFTRSTSKRSFPKKTDVQQSTQGGIPDRLPAQSGASGSTTRQRAKPSKTVSGKSPFRKKPHAGPSAQAGVRRHGPRRPQMNQRGKQLPIPPLKEGDIRIIPLGGVEEIGRNMTLVEYKDDIIVIDAGIEFADEDTPGIDWIIPNVTYLEERKKKIRALVITHGHLDHIGAIPYVIEKLGNPPIYTLEFAAMLIKKRHSEFPHLPELNIKIIEGNETITISKDLKVRFFGVTHAIPDSSGVIIETPYGDIVNTGDIRVENIDGIPIKEELEKWKEFNNRTLLLFTMDSTGIERPGWSVSEPSIRKTIEKIIKGVTGRVIIATFASQLERVIDFINMAKAFNKKVIIEGRSMKTNVDIVKQLGLVDTSHLIPIQEAENYPPNKILMIVTGGQGEEFSALMRMSNKTHRQIRLNKTDTVILSSSIIPGNEGSISKLKDNLYRHDAKIFTYLDSNVHAGGHGPHDDLEWIHKQIKYKFFMPVHGHHYMLKMHAEMARSLGTPRENILVPDNGSIVEIRNKGKEFVMLKERAPANMMMVDGFEIGGTQEVVIRDRKMLAQDGIFVLIATINTKTGKLNKSPDIIARGFVYVRESQELLQQSRNIIKKTVEDGTAGMNPINFDYIKRNLVDNISRFLYQKTAKRPLVIPVIISV